jgi:hypothetical protein
MAVGSGSQASIIQLSLSQTIISCLDHEAEKRKLHVFDMLPI